MKTRLGKSIEKVKKSRDSLVWKFLSFLNRIWISKTAIIFICTITLVMWIIIMYFAWR
jgi:hypothetical protein